MVERLKTHSPMGRMGEPHELKGALVVHSSNPALFTDYLGPICRFLVTRLGICRRAGAVRD